MSMSCKKCEGQGVIDRDGKLYECECERWRRIALSMDVHIRKANCLDDHIQHPLVDMVKQSCFVIASWADMKPIIKVSIIKHWPKLIKITSDALIRNVFVGGASKNARSSDYDGEIYNNLQDYMDPPDLMIVRLNELSYKNRAASGALEEAVSYRLDREKATWVLSDLDHPFTLGSHAFSESVADLFNSAFKKVSVPRIAPRIQIENSIFATGSSFGANTSAASVASSTFEPEEAPKPKPKPQFGRDSEAINKPKYTPKIKSAPDEENPYYSLMGQGVSKSKKFRGRGD